MSNSYDKMHLEELHSLLDCVENDMTLNGIDEFNVENLGTLGQTLLEFFQYHETVLAELKELRVRFAKQPTGTEAKVVEAIASRQRVGLNKYGMSVADNPLNLRQWLQHAFEESLDLPVYLRRAIEEIDSCKENPDSVCKSAQSVRRVIEEIDSQ